jgi:SAM-dependent methyltransferase
MDPSTWNQRYSEPGYAYGIAPNEFLVFAAQNIPPGRVLSLGEGEGRNAVFLAERGYEVLAVDSSSVGLAKAQELAGQKGVTISTQQADLADFSIEADTWDGIISIFCHLPPEIRKPLYRKVVRGLKPGGVLVLESYTPNQLNFGTGGPKEPDRLLTLSDVKLELTGLDFVHAVETERTIREGSYHSGLSAVVQIIGIKPQA